MLKKQYFGVYFDIEKFTNFDGTTAVSFSQTECELPYKITAGPLGIRFSGSLNINTEENLRDYARLIADVWREHVKLQPKITSATGH